MFTACRHLNFNPSDECLERVRIGRCGEVAVGDCTTQGAANRITDHVSQRDAEKRVAREGSGALSRSRVCARCGHG